MQDSPQATKNKRRLITLVLLVCATVGAAWYSSRSSGGVVDEDLFRLDNYKAINKVVLESPNGVVELGYRDSKWRVNDTLAADVRMIQVLFATMQQAAVKRPLAGLDHDSIARNLEENGIHVTLFEGDEAVQRFVAGGNRSRTQSYFKFPGSDEVYAVVIPGYRVYVSGIFEMTPNQWREKYVFGFNWVNFRELEVTFPTRATEGFRITRSERGFFEVDGLADTDTAKVNAYLDQVSLLMADEFLSGVSTDTLAAVPATMILTIGTVADTTYTLSLFAEEPRGVPGLLNGREAVLFSRERVEAILRGRLHFRKG